MELLTRSRHGGALSNRESIPGPRREPRTWLVSNPAASFGSCGRWSRSRTPAPSRTNSSSTALCAGERKRPSKRWYGGTGRWCLASAGACCTTGTTPRTCFRPRSWCSPVRPTPSASRLRSAAGSIRWRITWLSKRVSRRAIGSGTNAKPSDATRPTRWRK